MALGVPRETFKVNFHLQKKQCAVCPPAWKSGALFICIHLKLTPCPVLPDCLMQACSNLLWILQGPQPFRRMREHVCRVLAPIVFGQPQHASVWVRVCAYLGGGERETGQGPICQCWLASPCLQGLWQDTFHLWQCLLIQRGRGKARKEISKNLS